MAHATQALPPIEGLKAALAAGDGEVSAFMARTVARYGNAVTVHVALIKRLADAGKFAQAAESASQVVALPQPDGEAAKNALRAALSSLSGPVIEQAMATAVTAFPDMRDDLQAILDTGLAQVRRQKRILLEALVADPANYTGQDLAADVAWLVDGNYETPSVAEAALTAAETLPLGALSLTLAEQVGLHLGGRPAILGRTLRLLREAGATEAYSRVYQAAFAPAAQPRHAILRQHAPELVPYYDQGGKALTMPYVIQGLRPVLRTDSFSTDAQGYRYTMLETGERFAPGDDPRRLGNALLVGGSTAFGVGASSDHLSLASCLSRGDLRYYNFGARAYVIPQNTISVLFNLAKLPDIKRVVLFAGWNEYVNLLMTSVYSRQFGSFFAWNAFCVKNNPILEQLDEEDWPEEYKVQFSLAADRNDQPASEEMLAVTENILAFWAMFARARGAEVWYVLQPVREWVDRTVPEPEAALFAALESVNPPEDPAHQALILQAKDWYPARLAEICQRQGLRFLDSNQLLAASPRRHEWLFVDGAHLTDAGYELMARLLEEAMGPGAPADDTPR